VFTGATVGVRPEAEQPQAFLRDYSLNNTNPAREPRGLFALSICGPKSLSDDLKS
jgi:hypothetical protein